MARRSGAAPSQARRNALLEFAALVRTLREEGGYGSAMAFYEASGGKGFWGCSYRSYMRLESGQSAPEPAVVDRLAAALQLVFNADRAGEFASAYLRVLLGEEGLRDLAGFAFEPEPVAAGKDEEGRAPPRRLGERESKAVLASPENYWCFTLAARDKGSWTPERMSAALGFTPESMARALKALAAAGLLVCDRGGGFRCPLAGQPVLLPESRETDRKSPQAYWEKPPLFDGARVVHLSNSFKASEADLRGYFPFLIHALHDADRHAALERADDTAIFLFELKARRLIRF